MAVAPVKIGLIVQGPLLSVGKDGSRAHIPKTTLTESGFVEFDCRENIKRVIAEFGHLFEAVVVSTWESELKPGDGWEGASIAASPDPGEVRRRQYVVRSRNKYRQFIGISRGIEELERISAVDYVLRIRTDQYLDLDKLVQNISDQVEKNSVDSDVIFVPFTRPDDFFVHDIYLASATDTMKQFCDSVLDFDMFEFIHCVHREMILKYAYARYKDRIEVPEYAYFPLWPPMGASRDTKRIFSYMFKNIFRSLGAEVFETVIWRGSSLNDTHISAQFSKRNLDRGGGNVKKNLLSVPNFISIDWKRYFLFLKETSARDQKITDQLHISLGVAGWKAWNKLRTLSRKLKITNFIYRITR
jgi:hypothetical protein